MIKKVLRYLLGFILFGIIIFSFYFNKMLLFGVSVFFIIIAMAEYRNMFKNKGIYPHKFIPELWGAICAYVFIFSSDSMRQIIIMPLIITGVILSFSITILLNKKPYIETSFSSLAAILMIICGLYIIKITYYFDSDVSTIPVLIYFSAVLFSDFMASRIGPLYTRIKLSPEISPNKTLLGSIAHVTASCLVCCLFTFYINIHLWQCILLGIILSVFSQLGDLTISMFKRNLGIKHSGSLFYDYGGILDRIDAFIFSAPATYYFLCLISYINQ